MSDFFLVFQFIIYLISIIVYRPNFHIILVEMSEQFIHQYNSDTLPLLLSSALVSAAITASTNSSYRSVRTLCVPSSFSACGTGDSFALLLDPRFHKTNFHTVKFYFKRLASLTGWDLPAPTSLLTRLFAGSWKAHYFLILQGAQFV